MPSNLPLLEFLIPTYQRFNGAIKAAKSVASQIKSNSLEQVVTIRIVDDASADFSLQKVYDLLSDWIDNISITVNSSNKGMSLNIYDMVIESNSQFCTVLTDDDWLFNDSLPEIVSCLQHLAVRSDVGAIFTPRYSYLEDGSLHCVVCRPFHRDRLIASGPINSLRYCHNGFVLTGFIFRSHLMAKDDWNTNIENAYFPIINFACILKSHSILFVDKNWFRHTVLNVCHWEKWGEGELQQSRRLYIDYMNAIAFIAQRSFAMSDSFVKSISIFVSEFQGYLRQIRVYSQSDGAIICNKGFSFEKRYAFWIAIIISPFLLLIFRVYRIFRRLLRRLHINTSLIS